ncbi:MAG TPA: DUF3592 domain-containing protein [Pseudonocardiaceae bacterium]
MGAEVELDLSGVLSVPGLNPLAAEHHAKAPHAKLPTIGQILPVIVDRADPTRFRIEWDQVLASAEPDSGNITRSEADAQQQSHTHSPGPDWDQATATVLTCHHAKVPEFALNQAPGGIVDLTVDVRLEDGYSYSTKTRVAFSTPERRAKVIEKGTELPVRVDPADPNRIVIDIDQIPNW